MGAVKRVSFIGLAASAFLLSSLASGIAAGPIALTEDQLDRITAGGAIVISSTDAQAGGALALTGTTSNAFVVAGASPYPGQPNLGPTGAVAEGTALAVGSNVTAQGQPPPSTATSVQTAGVADGNLVFNSTINHTTQGAGGVTFQAGWTFVYGAWVGL